MKRLIGILTVTAAWNYGVAIGVADSKTALTGEQLRSELVGKTLKRVWTNGKNTDAGTQTLATDGTVSLKMDSGFVDSGTWTIKGNLLCEKWKTVQSGCAPIYKMGDGKFVLEGKKGEATTFSP